MRLATILMVVLVGLVTQSCRIEMPSFVELTASYNPYDKTLGAFPYNFGKSAAVTLLGGFRDTLVITDDPKKYHGIKMADAITGMHVPRQNLYYSLNYFYDRDSPYYNEPLSEKTRIVHMPLLTPFSGPRSSAERILNTNNLLFVVAAGNAPPSRGWDGDRDLYRKDHVYWNRKNSSNSFIPSYEYTMDVYATGKAVVAASAAVTAEGAIVPSLSTVKCGDIKEVCYAVIPQQSTSYASARLAAMSFYLSQLYPSEEEVRETLEVCAVDVGEDGIDREYGRGLANLLCPRVLKKELEIVGEHLEEKSEQFTTEGGAVTGFWQASGTTLRVYMPTVLSNTIKTTYTGKVTGTLVITEKEAIADFSAVADVAAYFLLDKPIRVRAEDTVRGKGAVTANTLLLQKKSYTYTATADSLHLAYSLTLDEALRLLPGVLGELARKSTEVIEMDPIQIIISFAKVIPPEAPEDIQTTVTESSSTLTWESQEEAVTSYRVHQYTDSTCTAVSETLETTENTLVFSDLQENTEYYFTIQAHNDAGWGEKSGCIAVRTDRRAVRGDFNGDYSVTFDDFLVFTAAFNTREGDQGYNALADLNNDGAVTFSDFITFVSLFQATG